MGPDSGTSGCACPCPRLDDWGADGCRLLSGTLKAFHIALPKRNEMCIASGVRKEMPVGGGCVEVPAHPVTVLGAVGEPGWIWP